MIQADHSDGNTEEEKSRKEELKQEAKARKEEEKAARAEEKRLAKEEQIANDTAFEGDETAEKRRSRLLPFTHKIQTKDTTPAANNANNDSSPRSPSSTTTTPDSPGSSKVKNWLKLRLHKPRANSIPFSNKSGNSGGGGEKTEKPAGGFVGGHRLTGLHPDGTGSLTSLGEPRNASMTEVALANTGSTAAGAAAAGPAAAHDEPGESSSGAQARSRLQTPPPLSGGRSPGGDAAVSSASSEYGGDDAGPAAWEAMRNMDGANKAGGLSPPAASEHSNRDSKFIEIIE